MNYAHTSKPLENPAIHLRAAHTAGKLDGARAMARVLLDLLDTQLTYRIRAAFARCIEREIEAIEAEHLRALDAIVVDAQKRLQAGAR